MEYYINLVLNTIIDFFNQATGTVILEFYAIFGWLFFVWLLAFVVVNFYADYIQNTKNTNKWKSVLLAIDIPPENVQTPLAVEQMFAHLSGAFDKAGFYDKFRKGYKQKWYSMEIVSIEGYIQFLVWTEEEFRDLVEASVYAQYPDAEITEVEDYVNFVPQQFPNKEYDAWIGDFSLSEDYAFPLRSYREFEHNISKDTVLKDPMGTFLESFTRIGPGEQMWFQIIVEPIDNSWKEKTISKIKEMIGESGGAKKGGPFSFITDNVLTKEVWKSFEEINAQVVGTERSSGGDADSGSSEKNQLKYLTPGQMKLVEDMEKKISKIGFKTKMRGVYVARKEVFKTERGVNALKGAINQFNSPTSNSIVEKSSTGGIRNPKKKGQKQTEFIKAYRKRKIGYASKWFVLNIEELATLWHFPMSHVKTPLVQKATTKAAEPPSDLPLEVFASLPVEDLENNGNLGNRKIITDSGDEVYTKDF
ncbi:MAG: hypothetical protein WC070_01905 [Candidatus Magasanikbacteria bacterium]